MGFRIHPPKLVADLSPLGRSPPQSVPNGSLGRSEPAQYREEEGTACVPLSASETDVGAHRKLFSTAR